MIKNYRRHQEKAEEIGAEIITGARNEKIIPAYVTPGGGKTLMASIFAHQLLSGGDVDRVLAVCPRVTLQTQMRDGFTVPHLSLTRGLKIGYCGTMSLLKEDADGCITTYQDIIGGKSGKWERFVKERNTLLILDEAHHLQDPEWKGAEQLGEVGWAPAIVPLVNAARRVLLMTGTITRDNGSRIAFLEYDKESRKPKIDIKYTRRDALDEHAILNVSVKLCDGEAQYWHRFSQHKKILANASGKDEARALRALLADEKYRNGVLDEALKEFDQYRSTRNERARMIVICADQTQCKRVHEYLQERGYRSVLAISKEQDAHYRLAHFRDKRRGDILVTCQMAHEGLDVPDCTHLVALTSIRSRPWLEQALSRVTRFDPKCGLPWEDQCAYLYVPCDHGMVSFLSEWIEEQDGGYCDPPETIGPAEPRAKRSSYSPISGEMTETRYADTYGVFSDPDQQRIVLIDKKLPYLTHLPAVQRLRTARMIWPDDDKLPHPSQVSEA